MNYANKKSVWKDVFKSVINSNLINCCLKTTMTSQKFNLLFMALRNLVLTIFWKFYKKIVKQ